MRSTHVGELSQGVAAFVTEITSPSSSNSPLRTVHVSEPNEGREVSLRSSSPTEKQEIAFYLVFEGFCEGYSWQ
ncbi:uncharacterized [Tachysurus ichikawai]